MTPSISLKARILRKEIEATVIHCIARDLDVPLHIASLFRRLFLVEGCVGEPLCVEVAGSAYHTATGEPAGIERDDPAADDDEVDDDACSPRPALYLDDRVLVSVAVGLVRPVGGPFKRNKSSTSIHRYVRLTPAGRLLAAQYIRMEAAAKARKTCLASTSFEDQIRQEHRAGRLSLRSPEADR